MRTFLTEIFPADGSIPWMKTISGLDWMDYTTFAGNINAIFFASAKVQQNGWPGYASNSWEPVKLSNSLMCGNLCDSGTCELFVCGALFFAPFLFLFLSGEGVFWALLLVSFPVPNLGVRLHVCRNGLLEHNAFLLQ